MTCKEQFEAINRKLAFPPVAKQGRDRLIGVSINLFYRFGINAVGLDRILQDAGVSKTTFYKHFECKDDLVVAAIEQRDRWEMESWQQAVQVAAGDDPRDQLLGLIDVLDVFFCSEDFRGCQFINAAAEFPNPSDPIHKAAAAHKHANWRMFRDLASSAGAADPDAFADAYTMVFEGALVLRQVHDRDDAAQAARPVVMKLIEEYLPSVSDE